LLLQRQPRMPRQGRLLVLQQGTMDSQNSLYVPRQGRLTNFSGSARLLVWYTMDYPNNSLYVLIYGLYFLNFNSQYYYCLTTKLLWSFLFWKASIYASVMNKLH
jgi:hypothetical protein